MSTRPHYSSYTKRRWEGGARCRAGRGRKVARSMKLGCSTRFAGRVWRRCVFSFLSKLTGRLLFLRTSLLPLSLTLARLPSPWYNTRSLWRPSNSIDDQRSVQLGAKRLTKHATRNPNRRGLPYSYGYNSYHKRRKSSGRVE